MNVRTALAISVLLACVTACGEAPSGPVVVDEPSVRLDAELNLHYKTFRDVTLSKTYVERWLRKYGYTPVAEVTSDEDLFAALDLDREGLEAVRSAVDEGDGPGAVRELATWFATRPAPCRLDVTTLAPSGRERTLEIADTCLEDPRFPEVPWPRERFGRGCKDALWNQVSSLFRAYGYTEETKYLAGAMEMFSFWYRTVRPPAGVPRIWLSPSFIDNPWGSHVAAYRVGTITEMDDALRTVGFDVVGPEARFVLYKSLLEHARFLIAINPGFRSGNIQIMQMLLLLRAGVYFPEFRESADQVDYAWRSLLKHAWLDLMPDGGHYERATGYNNAVVRFWRVILGLSRAAGLTEPSWLAAKLEAAQEWTTKVYAPTRNMPPVGDSTMGKEGCMVPYLIDGALLFPRPDFKFFVEDHWDEVVDRAGELFDEEAPEVLERLAEIESEEPSFTSVLLPDTGWAVMRSGWGPDALYLLFDYGSNEPWHCHRDGLGFSVFAYGRPLVTDCGHGGSYESDRSKEWYKETIAHNVVAINGMSQRKVTSGTCDRWVSTATCDYVDAEHDGYRYLGAYCRRKITFVKPTYWIITDNITEKMCQTSGFHECRWLAHFQPTVLTIDPVSKSVHTSNADANVLLVPARPESMEVTESTGWTVTPEGEVDDAPYIAFEREGDLPVDFEVVVHPYEGTDVPDLTIATLDTGADAARCRGLAILTPEGTDYYLESLRGDTYFEVDETTGFRTYGDFAFDGEMALVREGADGLTSIVLVGGTELRRGGRALVGCPGGVDWVEVVFSEGSAVVTGVFRGAVVVTLPGGEQIEVEGR